jgi:hypothetical protein
MEKKAEETGILDNEVDLIKVIEEREKARREQLMKNSLMMKYAYPQHRHGGLSHNEAIERCKKECIDFTEKKANWWGKNYVDPEEYYSNLEKIKEVDMLYERLKSKYSIDYVEKGLEELLEKYRI